MNLPVIIQIQFWVIGILILLFLVFAGIIMWQRSKKNSLEFRLKRLEITTERWIFEIIHKDDFAIWVTQSQSKNAIHSYLENHYKSYIDKLLFIDILVNKTNSFSGDIGERICAIFFLLELDKIVLDELDKGEWDNKANAMKAAAAMKITEADSKILRYINSPNQILRQEARIAFVSTSTSNLQYLLTHIKLPISDWEIIQIINIVSKNKSGYLLNFTPVFDKSNSSLSILSLRIINYFILTHFSTEVAKQLNDANTTVVNLTIQTLGVLNYASALPIFKIKYTEFSEKSKMSVLNIFATLGTYADIEFIEEIIKSKPSNGHILLAIKALLSIGLPEDFVEEKLSPYLESTLLKQMIEHNLDKRIVRYV